MSALAILALALSMSMDTFAAALGRGAAAGGLRVEEAVCDGAVFGIVQALMPVVGWMAGTLAADYVVSIDHWIAFVLLGLVGGRMLLGGLEGDGMPSPASRSRWSLLLVAVGTSIDALAVGVSLGLLASDIWVIAGTIGATTFLIATSGLLAGRFLGRNLGRIAEVAGGLGLIALGCLTLFEHLSA